MNNTFKTIESGSLYRRIPFSQNYWIKFLMLLCCCFMLFISSDALAQLTYKELQVQYDSPWTFKNLQIIPIRFKAGEGAPAAGPVIGTHPLSLPEAMLKNKIKVQEMQYEKGADVNWLQVTNQSKQDVVIESGQILEGGKQDRMIGETKILAAGSTDYINVFCVEKRRWTDKPKKFATAGVANSELQKAMNLKKRQSEVWREIDRQFAVNNKKSETFAYIDLYKNTQTDDSDYIRFFINRYSQTDSNFAGFIFLSGNRIISTELFCTAQLTDLAFRNVLNSNVQTARANGSPPKVPVTKAREFMDKVIMNESSQKMYVTAHGKLQLSNGKVMHLIAYDE